jgi:pyruvate,orthophosphate dikinase
MVFGNRNERSGSGVLFTRDPNTGERVLRGQWLSHCQGEDVVSGRYKTESIETLAEKMPEVYQELKEHVEFLEATQKDVQDVEFTIEDGRLFLLQTRDAKRSPEATIKIAADMAREGIIEKATAVDRAKEVGVGNLVNMEIDHEELGQKELTSLMQGKAVCSGAVNGVAVFDQEQATDQLRRGQSPIVFAEDSLTEDIEMMQNASAMAVFRGNEASHAAVVARGMGLPYVCDLPDPQKIEEHHVVLYNGTKLKLGDAVCLDGISGRIYQEHLPLRQKEISNDLELLAEWDVEIAEKEGGDPTLYNALERVKTDQPEYDNVLQEIVYGGQSNETKHQETPPWHHDRDL